MQEAEEIVRDPLRVAAHKFFPFIRYAKQWRPFRRNKLRKTKTRHIRYAARGDAYIFMYYRHLLSELYEVRLRVLNLSDCVIAYRKIPADENHRGGKCNIHFAAEAFDAVTRTGKCCAVALDISSFFESLDHCRLMDVWCDLLGVQELPSDHAAVFKNITRYSEVDRDLVYERLGYAKRLKSGRWAYTLSKHKMPMQLCTPRDFRAKVADSKNGLPKLIQCNKEPYGIPQGAPISDLLANVYLLDFDKDMAAYARSRGGIYLRYSDDILIVLPGDGRSGRGAREYAARLITRSGKRLFIKHEKSSTVKFSMKHGHQVCQWLSGGKFKDGLEYLGFRFDGSNIFLRDSTLSNLNRKIKRSLRAEAHYVVARYPGKDIPFLVAHFDFEEFMQRFSRVKDFDQNKSYREWTFWTYARRAAEVMGSRGQPIFRQLRNHRSHVMKWVEQELRAAVKKRSYSRTRC